MTKDGTTKPATLADIARKLGVTPMTVSYALKGSSQVSQATRERVTRAAQEMGYRPNAVAQSLKSRRTNIIGLYSGVGYLDARNEYLAEIFGGLQSACDKFHKDLLVHGSFAGRSAEDIYREVASGKIDGLIILQSPASLAHRLSESHLPAVSVGDITPNLPSVVVDDAEGSRLLARHLHQKGYRQILYRRRVVLQSANERFEAFENEARKLQMEVREFWADIKDSVSDEEQQFLLNRREKLAIVGWEDPSARAAMQFCRAAKLRVPEDVGLAGFNGFWRFEERPSLTTIKAPWAQAAQIAVSLLCRQIEGENVPDVTMLPVELYIGDTT
jgi:DNA-binding LacI/PurR family transcriptional regulator